MLDYGSYNKDHNGRLHFILSIITWNSNKLKTIQLVHPTTII